MTALAVPEGLEPLAVWDAKDRPPGWTSAHTRDMCRWIAVHLGLNTSYIERIEIYVLDGPFAAIHQFDQTADGHKYHDPATDGPARLEPVFVPLAELPPAHLLRG